MLGAQELENKLEVAERILKLAELNRKLETGQEKILPFQPNWQPSNTVEEVEDVLRQEQIKLQESVGIADSLEEDTEKGLSAYGVDADDKPVEEWDYLNNFFKRVNKVM